MARPKEFNRDEALGKAVEVFWAKGFEATTMTDLRKAMGIGRQSLYDTFGDKHELFAEALQRYSQMTRRVFERTMAGRGLDGVHEYMTMGARRMSEASSLRGCLTMNTCVERAPHDASVAALATRNLGDVQAAFEGALARAVDRGEVRGDLDVRQSATFLVHQMAGMAVLAQSGTTLEDLESNIEMALSALT